MSDLPSIAILYQKHLKIWDFGFEKGSGMYDRKSVLFAKNQIQRHFRYIPEKLTTTVFLSR
ncbi:hypothetical protein ELAC_2167 [Estrella lausannensis]|uniref:Uncharacterized protein n=1 Tax=Estrella lausannensis TaxID=483423 RepID=A0A0H5DS37_9BACT|nr:hypothetical protein ELAC_2167 [Estrella lausannensis]